MRYTYPSSTTLIIAAVFRKKMSYFIGHTSNVIHLMIIEPIGRVIGTPAGMLLEV